MSKWKTGKEIIDEEGIKEIEFFDDYVRKGLQPHNELGRPITPSGILKPDSKGKTSAGAIDPNRLKIRQETQWKRLDGLLIR